MIAVALPPLCSHIGAMESSPLAIAKIAGLSRSRSRPCSTGERLPMILTERLTVGAR
jgi:hypothetical protein